MFVVACCCCCCLFVAFKLISFVVYLILLFFFFCFLFFCFFSSSSLHERSHLIFPPFPFPFHISSFPRYIYASNYAILLTTLNSPTNHPASQLPPHHHTTILSVYTWHFLPVHYVLILSHNNFYVKSMN